MNDQALHSASTPGNDPSVVERMRADWDARAKEDANYYVAFGRRDQDGDEFESTAIDVVPGLERELLRLAPNVPVSNRRALEIGCGPGRLMKPMSPALWRDSWRGYFGRDGGRGRGKGWPPCRMRTAHVALRSNLEMFAGGSFHFVYSYAVFQHIPSREVVTGYWREAARVLAPGGIFRFQCSGLPPAATESDTWSGVRFTAMDVRKAAAELGLQLLALEGVGDAIHVGHDATGGPGMARGGGRVCHSAHHQRRDQRAVCARQWPLCRAVFVGGKFALARRPERTGDSHRRARRVVDLFGAGVARWLCFS